MNKCLATLRRVESKFDRELRELRDRVERCETLGTENSKQLKLLDQKFNTELSKYYSKQEEIIPYVFDPPDKNKHFTGRVRELQQLERILKPDDAAQEKKALSAAICGLGGVGKTSLVTEYAHRMKDYYQGGVYWLSAEDDAFFESSVDETALKLDASLGTFDLTLANTLKKLGKISKPCLIVVDCLDQLNLSRSVLKFLSNISRQSITAAIALITRRNQKKLVDEISNLDEDRCLNLKCFEADEAKNFLFQRTELIRDENANSIAGDLVEQLGGLPLALEQAGACIRSLGFSLLEYLQQFRTERLKLLEKQRVNPVAFSESEERLAVHTTWLLNFKHIQNSPHGEHAIRLMNAYAFLNPSEIEPELVNVGEREIEGDGFGNCVSSPVGRLQVVKLLTDFSLFVYVHAPSVSTHRIVQELVRENLGPEEKAKSFVDAVRLLSFAFSKCESPKDLLGNDLKERVKSVKNRPQYYLWSKLCFHAFYLLQNTNKFLENPDPKFLGRLFFPELSKILYEHAVYLSANQKQCEAKYALNFAYRMLDWMPVDEYNAVANSLSDNTLLPSHSIPLPKWFQIGIKRCCVPPIASFKPLEQEPSAEVEICEENDLQQQVAHLKLEGNENFKNGHFKGSVVAYSSAIDMSEGKTFFDPVLLTNRASAYIKLGQLDDALKDANCYISRLPECWKGYARKALALQERVSAEIAAAMAYYYFYKKDGRCIFSEYKPFKEVFPELRRRISVCDTMDQLTQFVYAASLTSNAQERLPIAIMGSKEYIFKLGALIPSMILNNCIFVGAKSNRSVTFTFRERAGLYIEGKCMFMNLFFVLVNGQINCSNGSLVKMLNCSFTSSNGESAAVASTGAFNAERCNFTNCKAGGLLCVGPSKMVVDNCTFSNNVKAGLEVRENGKLTVRNSRMFGNSMDGLLIGPNAAECYAYDCQIYHNAREGVAVVDGSRSVTLVRNRIFENYTSGVFVRNSEVDMKENNFFDNESWGIWAQTNSSCHVSMNEVHGNKIGGIRIGKRLVGKQYAATVVELNKISENLGPGYVNDIQNFEKLQLFTGGDSNFKSGKFIQNVEFKNEEKVAADEIKAPPSWCSGCFEKSADLKRCGKCFTAAYCNRACQLEHWPKHKRLCKVLREKSSIVVNEMKRVGRDGSVNVHAKGLDDVGPKYSPPPPRNGEKFIVKVQTNFEASSLGNQHSLIIYDKSLDIYETFEDQFIDLLVKEFGVICQRQYQEKKLFFYCSFEKSGKLRLSTNNFANFQKW